MSATTAVVLGGALVVLVLVGLWLRGGAPVRSQRSEGVATPATPAPILPSRAVDPQFRPARPLTTSEIAWAVCGGIWLFVISAGVLGVGVLVAVLWILHTRG